MIDEELLRTLASTDEPATIRPLPQIAARAAVLRRRRRGITAGAALAAGVAVVAVVTGPNVIGHHSFDTILNDSAASATPTATPSPSVSVTPSATPSASSATRTAVLPPVTPTPRAGTPVSGTQVHAKFVSLKSGMIAYNEVQWFDGAAAERECRKDGLEPGGSPWCTAYYYRDTNPRVRRLPVAKDMVIKVPEYRVNPSPNAGSTPTRVTLSQLQKFVASQDPVDMVVLTIRNGEITEFDELFLG